MKSIFDMIAHVWLFFSLIAGAFIWHCYDCRTEKGAYFVEGDHLYWVGYLGEIDWE